jgi:hypothetical protein
VDTLRQGCCDLSELASERRGSVRKRHRYAVRVDRKATSVSLLVALGVRLSGFWTAPVGSVWARRHVLDLGKSQAGSRVKTARRNRCNADPLENDIRRFETSFKRLKCANSGRSPADKALVPPRTIRGSESLLVPRSPKS